MDQTSNKADPRQFNHGEKAPYLDQSLFSTTIGRDNPERSFHLRILTAAYKALPKSSDIEMLLEDAQAAEARGYYNPDEDERLRVTYARYLAIRVSLWEVIKECEAGAKRVQSDPDSASQSDICYFGLAFCAAEIIVRTGEYLIDLARQRKAVWQKLDEAEKRYGIPRKSFTRLYRQLTSAIRMHGFYRACDFFDEYRGQVFEALKLSGYETVIDILIDLNLPTASRGNHLRRYRRFLRHSLKRRHGSALRNILFSVFEMMGSDIADLKIPLVKPLKAEKRVTPELRHTLKSILQPGDVFVTRHDDAMSNLFLPGFWPHAALWLGAEDADILEAKKDGVLLRNLEETLQVDAFVLLRPKLKPAQISAALSRARSHTGKLYDFIFDFSTADRLVCTEVIYRTYNGVGEIDFKLGRQAGRYSLSAEDLLNQSLQADWFDVIAVYGLDGDNLQKGVPARNRLRTSFSATF